MIEQINEVTACTPKLRFEMQQIAKDLDAKLERLAAVHAKDLRETEAFLQNLHSEVTSINLKLKPQGGSKAQEQLLSDITLEHHLVKQRITASDDRVTKVDKSVRELAVIISCAVEAVRLSTDFQFNRGMGPTEVTESAERQEFGIEPVDAVSDMLKEFQRPQTQQIKNKAIFGHRTLHAQTANWSQLNEKVMH